MLYPSHFVAEDNDDEDDDEDVDDHEDAEDDHEDDEDGHEDAENGILSLQGKILCSPVCAAIAADGACPANGQYIQVDHRHK